MTDIRFDEATCGIVKYYVYRLVDPRNGQTFYVGKGKNNRVFDHAHAALKTFEKDETEESTKLGRIRDILNEGLEVIHIIQRYGMSESEAFEVEAALIDAYSGLTNLQSGHNSDRGAINAITLAKNFSIKCYEEPKDIKYIIIKTKEDVVNNDRCKGSVYEATRYAWKINPKEAKGKYVLGVVNGIVKGVFETDENGWVPAEDRPGRYQFVGHDASDDVAELFRDKRIPDYYIGKGKANPVVYSINSKKRIGKNK